MEFLDILIELEEEKINCTDPNSLVTKNGCKCRLATKDVGFGCRYFKAILSFFCKIAYFIIDEPFMWKSFDPVFEMSETVLMERNAFFIELDNVFQIWATVVYFLCHDSGFGQIWSFSINLLRKVNFEFVPSQKRFKDRESEFSKSFDHLSCCWLNVVPVQTDSHMVKRVWYNMKIHPFSGKFIFFEIFQKFL